MNNRFRNFAPIGLYISLLGALASIGLYIVQRQLTTPLWISLGSILIGLALFALLDPERTRQILTGRQVKYGSNSFVLTLAFLGIVVVINLVGYANSKSWDVTEDKNNSLAKESLDTLASLPSNVSAEAYYSARFSSDTAKHLLNLYQQNSQGKFTYSVIDPEANPVQAQQNNVTRDGTIVLKMDDRKELLTYASEQEITAALIRLANPGERTVYFVTGHGEYDPKGSGERAYSQVASALGTKNYTVNDLSLLASPVVPDDAQAVIVAGSTQPLTQPEVDALKDYLTKGGSLVVLAEPLPVTSFGDQEDLLGSYLSANWGVTLANNIVIDPNFNPPVVAVSSKYGSHAITDKMYNLAALFPTARSVLQASAPVDGVTVTSLVETASTAWGETDFEALANNQVSADSQADQIGPLTLAIAATGPNDARLVVIGDADFANDSNYSQYGNGDFIMNSIDWAAEQENMISLTPKTQTERVIVAPTQTTLGLILLMSVVVLPGIALVGGITVWVARKRRS